MIRIDSVETTWNGNVIDLNGEILSAGDVSTHKITITESIFYSTGGVMETNLNSIFGVTPYETSNTLRFPSFQSINGFKVGQSFGMLKYYPNGLPPLACGGSIDAIDYSTNKITFSTLFTPTTENAPVWGQIFNNVYQNQLDVYSTDLRNNFFLNLSFNFRENALINNNTVSTQPGNYISQVTELRKSPVDNTNIRLWAGVDTATMSVGDDVDLVQLGFKSGTTLIQGNLKRIADIDTYTRQWEIVVDLINPIHLLEDLNAEITDIFDQRLTVYSDIEWYSSDNIVPVPSIQEQPTVVQHDLANITFFNDPQGLPNTLVQAVTGDLYFNDDSIEYTVIINDPNVSQAQFGCAYIPTNPTYFKNKIIDQSELDMIIATQDAAIGTFTSAANPDGATYDIEITDYTYAANNHTIKFILKPSSLFEDFIEARSELDRMFYFWVKVGQTCHLVFKSQLVKSPKLDVLLDDYKATATDWVLMKLDDLSQNYPVDDSFDGTFPVKPIISTEDNILMTFELEIPKNILYQKLRHELIFAQILDITNFITLESYEFDLTQNVYDPTTGKTTFNNQMSLYNLNSNTFNLYRFRNNPLNDGLNVFGATIVAPLLFNWRYWLTQNNVFSFMFAVGKTTKDYQTYINAPNSFAGGYMFFIKTTLESATFEATHHAPIYDVLQYDQAFSTTEEEWAGSTELVLKIDSSGEVVDQLIINEIMRVEFVVTTGLVLAADFWGMLTIEQKELNFRYDISTNFAYSNQSGNPFIPQQGETKLKATTSGTNDVTYSCLIDTSNLLGNEYKITGKHWSKNVKVEQVRSSFDKELDYFDTDTDITESDVLDIGCCEIFNVFANESNLASEFNDVTLIVGKKLASFSAYEFWLCDSNDAEILSIPVNISLWSGTDVYNQLNWINVLTDFGIGCYTIKVKYTSNAVDYSYVYGKYNLQVWNLDAVRGTVKINSVISSKISYKNNAYSMNSIFDLDFTNLNLLDTIRVPGFFGKRKFKAVIDNIKLYDRSQVKTYREYFDEYDFTSVPITKMYANRLMQFNLLNENTIFIWDYNSFNHEYFSNIKLIVKEILDPEHKELSNKSIYSVIFADKELKNKSGY